MKILKKILDVLANPLGTLLDLKIPEGVTKECTKRPIYILLCSLLITLLAVLYIYFDYIF